jgi:hypothetical protein
MKRLNRELTDPEEYKSTKRKKSDEGHTEYSKRDVPWKEQKTLGPRFVAAGAGNWPARCIIAERTVQRIVRKRQVNQAEYKVEWEPHPLTGEIYEPSGWVGHLTPNCHRIYLTAMAASSEIPYKASIRRVEREEQEHRFPRLS